MRITPIVLVALMMDIFIFFGAPALVGDAPQPFSSGTLLGKFYTGDMNHADEITMNKDNITGWVNLTPQQGITSDILSSIMTVVATIDIFLTFITGIVINAITFPFDLLWRYHLNTMFAVIAGAIYSLLNITAIIELASGRRT